MKSPRKVLLIGWDAADWKVITPLLDAGKMPALERFINQGVMGNIATLNPILSPMLWTSIATGVRPYVHGIHGFSEPDPDSGGVRPITNTTRKVKAVWNILNQSGYKSNVIGWWPSHPAEPINGVMVSNHYQRASKPINQPWPMLPGTVHPPELAPKLAPLRLHPAELTPEQILHFVPKAAEVDQKKDKRLTMVSKILADCSTIHACATAVLQLEPWDFMAVYYDAIDHFGHGFMKYHPPRQAHIAEKDFERYKDVTEAGYRFHDMMLGALLKLAGPETTVILMSDHGFHPDHLRPTRIPHEPAGPAIEHRPYGILAMKGPGIKQDERIYGATLLDIAPTILTLFGLPVGDNMEGHPLVQAFEEPPAIKTIPTWEAVDGETGTHPAHQHMDPQEAQEIIKQLVDLGYIEDPGENKEEAVRRTVREADYNLAQAYMDGNRYAQAQPLLEKLWAENPDELRFANRLAVCYQVAGNVSGLRTMIEAILHTQQRLALEARTKLQEYSKKLKTLKGEEASLEEAVEAIPPEDLAHLMQAAQEGEGEGEEGEDEKRPFNEKERREIAKFRAQAVPNPFGASYLMAALLLAEDKPQDALEHLQYALNAQPRLPSLHLQLGRIYLRLKRWRDAETAFNKALEIDPDNAQGHYGLCLSYLPRRRTVDAANQALAAVGLQYHFPQAHFNLGVALHRIDYLPRALEALQVALRQNPNMIEAHQRLAYIYSKRLDAPEKAALHKEQIRQIRRRRRMQRQERALGRQSAEASYTEQDRSAPVDSVQPALAVPSSLPPALDSAKGEVITVVSGLPRSGTSMMMQMLHAGGLACLTDAQRPADDDNPKGYFEFEPVKSLRRDASWLPQAQGKGVKIIAQLLPLLPPDYQYRIVFMDRALDEVVASQRKMLQRQSRRGAQLTDERLHAAYRQQMDRVKIFLATHHMPVLYVAHAEALQDPHGTAKRVAEFLGVSLDRKAMVQAVDRQLYRQRQGEAQG